MVLTKKIIDRVLNVADYVIDTKKTIRQTALVFNMSKSTIHKDLKERLLEIDVNRYNAIKKIMQEHLECRHIRGGESTKKLFFRKKQLTL